MNKMVMAVIMREKAEHVLNKLVEAGYAATFLESRGGMLRQSQLTLFVAVQEEDVEDVLSIVRENCCRRADAKGGSARQGAAMGDDSIDGWLGGGVLFVWDLGHFEVC